MKKFFAIIALYSMNCSAVELKGLDGVKFGDEISNYQDVTKIDDFYLRKTDFLNFQGMLLSVTPISNKIVSVGYGAEFKSSDYCKKKQDVIMMRLSEKLNIEFKQDNNNYQRGYKEVDRENVSIMMTCRGQEFQLTFVSSEMMDLKDTEDRKILLEKTKIKSDAFIK